MFEKVVMFEPAYDKRDPNPSKNYGIHGVNLRFVLKGALGAVHFCIYTDWQLPEVDKEMRAKFPSHQHGKPTGADISYHSRTRIHESDWEHEDCAWLDGEACYSDGSSLYAEKFLERLIREGDTGLWAFMEEYYNETYQSLESTANSEVN